MKKFFLIMFMALVAMVCVTTFTACGGSDDDTLGSDYSDITIGSHRIDVEFEGNTTPWTTTVGFSAVKASASGMGAKLYENGKEFTHEGGTYCVEIKKSPILVDEEGKRFEGKDFAKVYAIDEQKAALARKQAELTAERRLALAKVISKHPYLRFDVKRTLKVKR